MARYDYECKECGAVREISHPMSQEPRIVCERCGSIMCRTIGMPSFRIKGYYTAVTGYSKDPDYAKAVEDKHKKERETQ